MLANEGALVEIISLSVISLLVASMIKTPIQQTCRTTMRHLKLKCQEMRQKLQTLSYINLAWFSKAIIKVAKMNTNDKQFVHEPRTRNHSLI